MKKMTSHDGGKLTQSKIHRLTNKNYKVSTISLFSIVLVCKPSLFWYVRYVSAFRSLQKDKYVAKTDRYTCVLVETSEDRHIRMVGDVETCFRSFYVILVWLPPLFSDHQTLLGLRHFKNRHTLYK